MIEINLRNFFCFHDENENEAVETHIPRHRGSKTKKNRYRDTKTKKRDSGTKTPRHREMEKFKPRHRDSKTEKPRHWHSKTKKPSSLCGTLTIIHPEAVLKNFAIFTRKHLCWSLFLNKAARLKVCNFIKKRLQHRWFPVKNVKFLRTHSLKNICKRLLVIINQSLFTCSNSIFSEFNSGSCSDIVLFWIEKFFFCVNKEVDAFWNSFFFHWYHEKFLVM